MLSNTHYFKKKVARPKYGDVLVKVLGSDLVCKHLPIYNSGVIYKQVKNQVKHFSTTW